MAVEIDKLAVVHKNAELGENCSIGPYCTIADDVKIGDGTVLRAHAYVDEHTTICLLYTSPSPRDQRGSRMPSSA